MNQKKIVATFLSNVACRQNPLEGLMTMLGYHNDSLSTSSNHRLESAGLNALEQLLFKVLGIEKTVLRALF